MFATDSVMSAECSGYTALIGDDYREAGELLIIVEDEQPEEILFAFSSSEEATRFLMLIYEFDGAVRIG